MLGVARTANMWQKSIAWRDGRLPTTPLQIFAISFLIGLLQIDLSFGAGIQLHSMVRDGNRFGYLECYNWSVTYLTVVPTILAACIPNTLVLYRQTRRQNSHRRQFLILLGIAFIYALATAGREAWASIYDTNHDSGYVEWNSVSSGEWNVPHVSRLQSVIWHALFTLGYAHYFIASFFGFVGAFGTFLYFKHASNGNKPRKLFPYESGLLFNQKVAVMAYLLYLVLLRSAKVSMNLVASGKAEETWKTFDLFKHGEAYLDIISGGLLVDLLFGTFWLIVTVATHGCASEITSPHAVTRTEKQFLQYIFNRAAHAYAYFGKGPRFWAGAFLFGVVIPAPGFHLLIAGAVLFATLRMVGSAWARSREASE